LESKIIVLEFLVNKASHLFRLFHCGFPCQDRNSKSFTMLPESQSTSSKLNEDNRSRSSSKSSLNSDNNNKLLPSKKGGKATVPTGEKSRYRIVVMGAAGVGKSAIISQVRFQKHIFM
jgi:hypothetical protein